MICRGTDDLGHCGEGSGGGCMRDVAFLSGIGLHSVSLERPAVSEIDSTLPMFDVLHS